MVEKVDHCEGCAYRQTINGGSGGLSYYCCGYIFIEDKRRPCPPGKYCTVKTTALKKKKPTVADIEKERERNRLKARAFYQKHKEEILQKQRERRAAKREG